MAALTDAAFYTGQVGTSGESAFVTAPKEVHVRYLPPIVRNLAGTESAADTFYIARLRKGQKLIPALSYVAHDDAGTTLTIDIGDDTDPDRYGDGIDLATAAGVKNFCGAVIPDAVPNPYVITDTNRDILVTIATSGTPAAADVVFYLAIETDTGDIGEL